MHLFTSVVLSALVVGSTLVGISSAHDHHFEGDELQHYRRSYDLKHRDLSSRCGGHLQERRRRRALDLTRRSTTPYKRWVGASSAVESATLEHLWARASDDNSSACLLTPEVTQGPYHILGELVQQDIRGGEPGIPLHLVVDFIDVDTCEPLKNAWIDVWGANATGYYSGYESSSSGMGGGGSSGPDNSTSSNMTMSSSLSQSTSAAASTVTASANASSSAGSGSAGPGSMSIVSSATIDSYTAGADSSSSGSSMGGGSSEPSDNDNFNRGVWQTDDDGVLTMYSIVPGWYSGRAPHVHLKVYESKQGYRASNGSFIANDTTSHHTGQWFFPDDVMDAVAAVSPYSNNQIAWASATKNADDSIYPYANSMGSSANLEITYINASDIAYGLIATTVVGINTTYTSAELTTWYWDPDQSNATSTASTTASAATSSASTSSASTSSTSV